MKELNQVQASNLRGLKILEQNNKIHLAKTPDGRDLVGLILAISGRINTAKLDDGEFKNSEKTLMLLANGAQLHKARKHNSTTVSVATEAERAVLLEYHAVAIDREKNPEAVLCVDLYNNLAIILTDTQNRYLAISACGFDDINEKWVHAFVKGFRKKFSLPENEAQACVIGCYTGPQGVSPNLADLIEANLLEAGILQENILVNTFPENSVNEEGEFIFYSNNDGRNDIRPNTVICRLN